MIDWGQLTLFLYIFMRMTGFVLFNPLLGRRNIPGLVRAGFIMVLSVTVISMYQNAAAAVPGTTLELMVRLLLELGLGYALGFVMHLFFYIPMLAGQVIDTQMGMSMATIYDISAQSSASVTSTLLNVLMALLFFAANGHHTLLRILITSGNVVPFGAVALGPEVASAMGEIFAACTLMAVKLSLPVLAAELITQVGVGVLMKAIPQINAFVINIELKVVVGLLLVWLLISPFSEFLLEAEITMLETVGQVLRLAL